MAYGQNAPSCDSLNMLKADNTFCDNRSCKKLVWGEGYERSLFFLFFQKGPQYRNILTALCTGRAFIENYLNSRVKGQIQIPEL